jgi:predicted RND superfamily exporter protein
MSSVAKEILFPLIGILISLVSVLLGVWATYRTLKKEAKTTLEEKVKKEYAAERDFNHLKREFEQLKQNLIAIDADTEERLEKLANNQGEMKETLAQVRALQMIVMAKSGDTESQIFMRMNQKREHDS